MAAGGGTAGKAVTAWHDIRIPASLLHQLHQGYAPLESPRLGYALLAVTMAFVGAWAGFFVWRRRVKPLRRAWPLHLCGSVGGVALTLVTVLAFVNVYAGYAPTISSVPSMLNGTSASAISARSGGRLRTMMIGAPGLDIKPRPAYVYLPRGYDAPGERTRRYPVVYLIHGYPGGAYDWLRAGRLAGVMDDLTAAKLIPPMIAVTPDANGSWFHDSECLDQVHGPQVETYLTRTVVAAVQHRFRTLTARRDRLFGGASSGGFCGLNIGLHEQREFGALLAFEPYGTPGAPLRRTLLGGSEKRYAANSPGMYIPHMRFRHHVIAYLDAGGAAPRDVRRVWRLAHLLALRGQSVAFHVVPHQTHTWREAANGLPYGLAYAARELRLSAAPPVIEAQRHHHRVRPLAQRPRRPELRPRDLVTTRPRA